MSSKVILLKYLPRIYDNNCTQSPTCCDKSAIVLKRVKDGFLFIQGYPLVHHSEKHKAWTIFQVRYAKLIARASY